MTYLDWLNNIKNVVVGIFSFFKQIYLFLMDNFVFKTIIYVMLFIFVLELLFIIISILKEIITTHKNKKKKKDKDIE